MDADGNGDVTLKEYVRAQMAQIRSSSYQQVREVLGPMVDELEVKTHTASALWASSAFVAKGTAFALRFLYLRG